MTASDDELGFATRAIHRPEPDPEVRTAPVAPSMVLSTSFAMPDVDSLEEILGRGASGYMYSRLSNPTVDTLERAVADLEGGEAAMAFTSGMAAIHGIATGLLSAGDHVVAPASVYGGTWAMLAQILPRFGVETTFVDNRDLDAWQAALRPNTKVVWAETITNPTLEVADLAAIARMTRAHGARLVVDATFATPYLSRPLALGADVVVHSASKYLGGHGDLLGGLFVTSKAILREVRSHCVEVGGTMAPFVAWLVLRGIKTLGLRVDRHCASALEVARFLDAHPRVRRTLYPGLPQHPDHEAAQERLRGRYGGMVSFEVDGDQAAAERVMDRLTLFLRAGSLGDCHSLAQLPAATSHRKLGPEARARAGIPDGLIRLSVGLEDPEDLCRDLDRALSA